MMTSIGRRAALALTLLGGMALGSSVTRAAGAAQPHMESALASLQRAENQLNLASPDKAGHRASALALVNSAIAQVNAGIIAGAR